MTTIEIGTELPHFTRETGLANWNRYAAVNDEFVPIHMDDDAGRDAGYESAFGMGNLQWAYLHNVLRQFIGRDGRIEKLACQFRAANTKGMTVTGAGQVTGVEDVDDGQRVEIELRTEDQDGKPLAPATATVFIPR